MSVSENTSAVSIKSSTSDLSISDKLQAVVDSADEAYQAGPGTINRKLNQVDEVLGAAVEAIQELDERTA
ncbi:hypothetical protein BH09ACT1_BH09ACT1_11580 [soil metagenome]